MNNKKVLVSGATGQQGGAVARALLARDHHVRALTRDVNSDAAKALADLGAELVAGDFANPASLESAMKGVETVFAMSTPFEAGQDAEIKQGMALIDAAVANDVKHFIFTSVASANQNTGIPHFESKFEIEKYLASSSLAWSVIAPVYFMENLFLPQTWDGVRNGTYGIPMPSDLKLQQVAVEDIGAFGAHVVEHREEFIGRRVDIAGDELNAEETATILADVLGHPINVFEVPMDQIRAFSEDFAIMYEWFISTGYSVDIDSLREETPEVAWHRFRDWSQNALPTLVV
jgi:uncharacterized protein YbjT (DUF2867 family)